MKNFINNPARRIVREAVKEVRNDRAHSPRPVTGNVIPNAGTTAAVDENGVVSTLHVGITNIDSTNSGATTGGW